MCPADAALRICPRQPPVGEARSAHPSPLSPDKPSSRIMFNENHIDVHVAEYRTATLRELGLNSAIRKLGLGRTRSPLAAVMAQDSGGYALSEGESDSINIGGGSDAVREE